MRTNASLPVLSQTAAARRIGEPVRRLESAARAGSLVRIRPGHYVDVTQWRAERPERRHLLLVIAASEAARRPPTFSHESAAALLGIPIVGSWPSTPQTIAGPGRQRRSSSAVTWHTTDSEFATVQTRGVFHTDALRTLVDIAAALPFVSGVAAVDHVLRRPQAYGVTKQDLLDAIGLRRPFRNARRAEAAVAVATGLADSPGESLSLVRFFEGHYATPTQQKRFVGLDGQVYFTDFYFEDEDAAGESDGWAKYEDPVFLAGRTPQQALRDEKRREDEIRAQVSAFIRWDWDDAWRRAPLYAKLERAGVHPRRGR